MSSISKICTKCKTEKSITEFSLQANGKYGVNSKCKECQKEYYYSRHKVSLDNAKKYFYANQKEVLHKGKEYYKNLTPGVYLIETNFGEYVGQSQSIEHRVNFHKFDKKSPVGNNIKKWRILEIVEDRDLRLKRESYWISKLNPILNTYKQ